MSADQAALIVGAGARQGIGGALAAKAAAEGLHVFIAGRTLGKIEALADVIRSEGGEATALVCDSTQEAQIQAVFEAIAAYGLPLRLVVYNTGRNLPAALTDSDQRLIEGHWRRCVLGAMLVGQGAVRQMLTQQEQGGQRGTIIYTGASASMRGKPMFAAFASAKAATRAMSQSMAREFGPKGIHVGHVVIDGLVDGAIVRGFGGLGKLLLRNKGEDGALQPDEVAQAFWMLHQQQPSAWTQEMDLRPYKESF